MPIVPLPQFEADLAEYEADRAIYEKLKPPTTIVVRFGFMKMIGEFPYDGDAKPGCGSKIVVRTFRGTEIGEMLTSTCPNSGCSKSVTRKQMLEYIENSGGRDYPFERNGRALRVATKEDMDAQAAIEQSKHELKMEARGLAERLGLPIKIVEAEPILGGEAITFYGMSEERVDPRQLIGQLEQMCGTRVELRQVGARDEARLTADYERCGQYCCCKNFLKVLKPISMRSAKVQKATLDPLKISGRCGRLMCCLRYEDQTYEDLRKRLPKRKSRVGTPDGDGIVIDTQILTQLVLVELDATRKRVAVPVEELSSPGERVTDGADTPRARVEQGPAPDRTRRRPDRPAGGMSPMPGRGPAEDRAESGSDGETGEGEPRRKRKRRRKKPGAASEGGAQGPDADGPQSAGPETSEGQSARSQSPRSQSPRSQAEDASGDGASASDGDAPRKKRRRRKRRGPGAGGADGPAGSGDGPGGRPDGPGSGTD